MKFRTKDFQLSLIKQVELSASKIPDVISLAQGIPSFSIPETIKIRLENAFGNKNIGKYSLTNGLPQLRESISLDLEKNGINADANDEIIITAGAIEAISATLLTLLRPGDEVILFGPSYASYQNAVGTAHGKIVWVNLKDDWGLDINSLKNAITKKTRAILFANPNNPTGTFLDKLSMQKIGKLANDLGIYLIVDEVYRDFIYEDTEYFSLLSDPKNRENVISVYSFSKSHALTGFRIGYLVASSILTKEIIKVHDALVSCAPVISQYAGIYAIEFDKESPYNFKHEFMVRRKIVTDWLKKNKKYFEFINPRAAYFVFPKMKFTTDSQIFCSNLLKDAKVAIVPGVAFGPAGEGHVRISYGVEQDKIKEGLSRIERYLHEKY